MRQIVIKNRFFFGLLGLFLLTGGIYLAYAGKTDALLFFNENRSLIGDQLFKYVTVLGEAPAYIVGGLVCLAIRLRYTILIAITGLVVLGVSSVLKELFAVDRPLAFFRKLQIDGQLHFIEGVDVHTGATSFPSGHAMSAFAIYSLLAFLLVAKKRYATALFALALLVSLSRVYLIQHFWQDVYAGALVGVTIAVLVYLQQAKYPLNDGRLMDRPVIKFRSFTS